MASIHNREQFQNLVNNKLMTLRADVLKEPDDIIPKLFKVAKSQKAFEEYFEIGTVPDVPRFNGSLTYLSIAPGYYTKIEPVRYAAGLMFDPDLIEDEKYGKIFGDSKQLMIGDSRRRNKDGVRVLSNSFSIAYDFMTSEEGVAMCSTSHSTKAENVDTSTGFSNAGTSPLTRTALAATRLAFYRFKNDVGELITPSGKWTLIVPPELEETAYEIVKTPKGYESGEGTVNFHYGMYEVMVVPWLTDTNNWWLMDSAAMKDNQIWIDRKRSEPNAWVDNETFVLKVSLNNRRAYGHLGWRHAYGHQVS